ncbi:hypothetical protein [Reyranella soli]|uniref:Uncharacterized protein n=1 Tax=Reyranella soli TaxID=1230389 RepID=A0A512N4Q9_9HYPH|nr:hypothetical protein [Reyranella soli]GEP53943.1 hypothetical protein RSO01_11090 [Reyranella soli]
MISPPTLIILVHAVQQPIGQPAFAAINIDRSEATDTGNLQTDRARGRTDPRELTSGSPSAVSRRPGRRRPDQRPTGRHGPRMPRCACKSGCRDGGELEWHDAPAAEASVTQLYEGQALFQKDLGLWAGSVTFTTAPAPDAYRLLIEEFEYISATYAENRRAPSRLIYAEIIEIDAAMVQG